MLLMVPQLLHFISNRLLFLFPKFINYTKKLACIF